jgi:hypothetical protein
MVHGEVQTIYGRKIGILFSDVFQLDHYAYLNVISFTRPSFHLHSRHFIYVPMVKSKLYYEIRF